MCKRNYKGCIFTLEDNVDYMCFSDRGDSLVLAEALYVGNNKYHLKLRAETMKILTRDFVQQCKFKIDASGSTIVL